MESTFQKITLYDILGYLLPGSVFLMLVLFGVGKDELLAGLGKWADDKEVLYTVFFIASYLSGIVLSEVMRGVWQIIEKLFIGEPETGLLDADIAAALKKSGLCGTEDEITRKVEQDLNTNYMQYMYGIVQKSEDHKRIHNYASALVLYKNISGALFFGAGCTAFFGQAFAWEFYVACICVSIIFLARGIRFEQKKNKYTVMWFVEKYLSDPHC